MLMKLPPSQGHAANFGVQCQAVSLVLGDVAEAVARKTRTDGIEDHKGQPGR